jgi:hypothetical protein
MTPTEPAKIGSKGKNKLAAAATKPNGKPGPKGKFQGF